MASPIYRMSAPPPDPWAQGLSRFGESFADSMVQGIEQRRQVRQITGLLDSARATNPMYQAIPEDQWMTMRDQIAESVAGGGPAGGLVDNLMNQYATAYAKSQRPEEFPGLNEKDAMDARLVKYGLKARATAPKAGDDYTDAAIARLAKLHEIRSNTSDPAKQAQLDQLIQQVYQSIPGGQAAAAAPQEAERKQAAEALIAMRDDKPGFSRVWFGDQTAGHMRSVSQRATDTAAKYGIPIPAGVEGRALVDHVIRELYGKQRPTAQNPFAGLSEMGVNPLIPPGQAAATPNVAAPQPQQPGQPEQGVDDAAFLQLLERVKTDPDMLGTLDDSQMTTEQLEAILKAFYESRQ